MPQSANRRGANSRLFRLEDRLQQIQIRYAMFLEHPQALKQCLRIVGIGGIQAAGPSGDFCRHFLCITTAQFQSRSIPRAVFFRMESLQHGLDGLALHLHSFDERSAFVGHSVDTTVCVIAVRIAHVVLHVPDQRVGPIGHIQSTVTADFHIGRSEVGIGRYQDRFNLLSGDVGTVVFDFVLQHAKESD